MNDLRQSGYFSIRESGYFPLSDSGDMEVDESQENIQNDSLEQRSCKVTKAINPSFLKLKGGIHKKHKKTARHKIPSLNPRYMEANECLLKDYILPALKGRSITFANQEEALSEGQHNLLRTATCDLSMTIRANNEMPQVVAEQALTNELGSLEL